MAPPSPRDLSHLFNSTSRLLSFLDLNDQEHPPHSMQNMENMDIDQLSVPDTPDRLSAQQSSSLAGGSGISNFLDNDFRNRVRGNGRFNVDSVKNRRLYSLPRGDTAIRGETQQNSHPVVDLDDSPSVSKNARLYKKMMFEKVSSRPQFTEHIASNNNRAKLDGDTSTITELLADDDKAQGKNKDKMIDLISIPKMPSNTSYTGGRHMRNVTSLQGNTSSDIGNAAVALDHGKGIDLNNDSKQTTESLVSRSLQSTALPRKNGQRRLVRNGCISPLNIVKSKCTADGHEKSQVDAKQNVSTNFSMSPSQIHKVSLISGGNDTDRVKGKRVVEECSVQKHDAEALHFSSRHSPSLTEEANIIIDASRDTPRTSGEIGGWRSTRNRSNNTSFPLSDGTRHLSRTKDGIGLAHEISDPVSSQRGLIACSAQAFSEFRSEMDRESGGHFGTNKIDRRQRKRGPACSNSGECSTSVFDDSEIAFLGSSEEPLNARSTRSRSNRHRGSLHTVIEIDDMSPEVHQGGIQNSSQMVNDDLDARARQMEADEILARELQEQFYHELPGVGGGEVDANVAWTLQHEGEAQHASSLRRQRVHPRDASMAHLYRYSQTHALQSSLTRPTNRANRGRARPPTSARMGRLRDRFLGNSPTISSRERSIHFHPNMDVEMRIHILEALEAAVGTSEEMMPSSFFQLQRDFNENDYEMLLALDENNYQHVGANPTQINGLPQSTVQTENFAEACAICLETPTIGDTIRHLPCLHKFHKECIDPWLRRKTSCPICKSGIT